MAVYWVDPCIGPGFSGITEACHGTTGTAKTGTYTNPWGLDEMFNTAHNNPLGLANGDEVRIKGEPDSFWWSSSTWNVRGTDQYINTSTTSSDSYFYLYNGNGVTRPSEPFNTAGGAAINNSLFMVNNTSDFHTGWDDRIMFAASKYGTTAIAGQTTDPHAVTMAYLSSASNQYQQTSNTYSNTASTNPEVELKWCEKIPSNTSSSSSRYFLGIYVYNVMSGGSSVSGKLVMGGVTVTDGWSSETAQTAGYYSILFAPHAHNTSSSGRSYYQVVGPISMRNCYMLGWRTGNLYYSRHAGGYYNFEGCQKPGHNINGPGTSVYTQTIYMPSMYGVRMIDNTTYNSSYSDAKYNDLRFGTLGMSQYEFRNRGMGQGSSYQANHTDYEQKHVERLILTRYNYENLKISYTPTSNRPNYIADAASASGTNGMHFGDIIAVPSLTDGSSKSIFKLTTDQVTIRLKDNSVYCSTTPPFVKPGETSTSKAPLNWHAGSNLQNAPNHSDFAQWPYAGEQSPGPICFSQSEASNTCPRNVIDASQTDFYTLNQIVVPMADSGAQTYTAGRINFVNADAGLFDKALLNNLNYHSNANYMAQLIFKECNLTENSGGPVIYAGSYDSVVSGNSRGCFAYTNSDNELVIIPNRDSSNTKCRALFYLPTTIPDMSSATQLTTTVEWYLSNWYALSGNTEQIVQYSPIYQMESDGSFTTAGGYSSRLSANSQPTQSNPVSASYSRTIGASSDIKPVTSTSINPGVAYIGVGIDLQDNTSLAANSRLIIKSLTVTVS